MLLLKLRRLSVNLVSLLLVDVPAGIFPESLGPDLCCSWLDIRFTSRRGSIPELDSVKIIEYKEKRKEKESLMKMRKSFNQ